MGLQLTYDMIEDYVTNRCIEDSGIDGFKPLYSLKGSLLECPHVFDIRKAIEALPYKRRPTFECHTRNHDGVDTILEYRGFRIGTECKNLAPTTRVTPEWLRENVYARMEYSKVDHLCLIICGGNISSGAMEMLANDPKITFKHHPIDLEYVQDTRKPDFMEWIGSVSKSILRLLGCIIDYIQFCHLFSLSSTFSTCIGVMRRFYHKWRSKIRLKGDK